MTILHNVPLIAAVVAIVTAQCAKVPLRYLTGRRWEASLALSTGGMPSSHSAAVTSLATVVGIEEGWSSSVFAVAAVVSAITMYDAAGIRRHAGFHASLLNRVVRSVRAMQPQSKTDLHHGEELKELLGHRPIEVFGGAVWGIGIGLLTHYLYNG
ncbi:divergent PAP2 family protein [Cohnella sp. AR92]|uniref:divergent PAP2 family protein n=1 Tax=Cohnella sp. AR92 TaxID=648716 RepID=UPI000F8E282A|nr:divergent PAP2 family protein [Cohnella sp. AR92]RUS46907.1 divergent PAP2 family protein [Cohnella sp. AR92]